MSTAANPYQPPDARQQRVQSVMQMLAAADSLDWAAALGKLALGCRFAWWGHAF